MTITIEELFQLSLNLLGRADTAERRVKELEETIKKLTPEKPNAE